MKILKLVVNTRTRWSWSLIESFLLEVNTRTRITPMTRTRITPMVNSNSHFLILMDSHFLILIEDILTEDMSLNTQTTRARQMINTKQFTRQVANIPEVTKLVTFSPTTRSWITVHHRRRTSLEEKMVRILKILFVLQAPIRMTSSICAIDF